MLKCVIIPVTHYQQNCSLVWCERTQAGVVIDPGGDLPLIEQAITQHGVKLTQVLLTHGHLDHVGQAKKLAEAWSVPIVGPHEADAFWLGQLPVQANMMGFVPEPAFEPDQWLDEGDTVRFGEVTLTVHHCPGHTPGHVVFVCLEAGLCWVGDVLFAGAIGRTDFPRGDFDTLVNSIRNRLWPLGDDVTFVPGHGATSTIGRERASNPFVADHKFG